MSASDQTTQEVSLSSELNKINRFSRLRRHIYLSVFACTLWLVRRLSSACRRTSSWGCGRFLHGIGWHFHVGRRFDQGGILLRV